ncbi:transcriptional regulator with XRE-family HTH domain [Enterococcus sp. PF1-24]|uniref:helix-turn-helix domain-containing protein n=1 Tax=unclassified Enterococcus TaxID=2608891 RepID=UPI002475A4C7|nr:MULTISPECIES: helix-turn-helix transcriptional regulator [unclassified Enterococcus]MDH6364709.1 transcriptional regulator with XRE-family HTH domain [Enterococcus sp. PFB1-1]MDH6401815.1 transcriptional regulator with XRE-family HTH domain [Enterococcus sp. PF1-24]
MNRVKELRLESGLSLQRLSDLTKIPKSTLSNYEHDRSKITIRNARELSKHFGVTLSYLMEIDDYKTNEELERAVLEDLIKDANVHSMSDIVEKNNDDIIKDVHDIYYQRQNAQKIKGRSFSHQFKAVLDEKMKLGKLGDNKQLSFEEISRMLGFEVNALKAMCEGLAVPTPEQLEKIINVLSHQFVIDYAPENNRLKSLLFKPLAYEYYQTIAKIKPEHSELLFLYNDLDDKHKQLFLEYGKMVKKAQLSDTPANE